MTEHGTGQTLGATEKRTAKDTQQKELEEDRHAERGPNQCPSGLGNEVQLAVAKRGGVVHAKAGGVGKFAAINAVGEPRFVHGRLKCSQGFSRQGDAHVHGVAIAVKRPFNGIVTLDIRILLDWEDGFVVQRPCLFIVTGHGGDWVDAFTGHGIVHAAVLVPGVLDVVFIVVFKFQRSEGKSSDDHETPAHQGELERTFRAPLISQFGETNGRWCGDELNDQNGEDQTRRGQAQHHNTKHAGKGGDGVDAVDETEVRQHVEEERSETLDVRKRGFHLAERHLG